MSGVAAPTGAGGPSMQAVRVGGVVVDMHGDARDSSHPHDDVGTAYTYLPYLRTYLGRILRRIVDPPSVNDCTHRMVRDDGALSPRLAPYRALLRLRSRPACR